MQDLRLVAANERGTHLVLRSPDGDKFLVAIDERLRAAIRGDKTLLSQLDVGDGQLRPRDIQAKIRAGASAEQVAREAGVHVDRVRRFEGPVLAEREHIAQMAQRSAVRRPGQAEARPVTLAEALPARLEQISLGTSDLDWDSWRREDGRWVVQTGYDHDGDTQLAKFLYDPRARTVVADNEQARWLTGELAEHPQRGPFVPRFAPSPITQNPAAGSATSAATHTATDTATDPEGFEFEDELETLTPVRRPDPTVNRRPPDVVARRTESAPLASTPPRPATVVTPHTPTPTILPPVPTTAPPVVPAARVEAPAAVAAPPPAARPEPAPRRLVVDAPTLPMDPPEAIEEPVEERRTGTNDSRPTGPSRPAGRSRRASVPSWDDILIGTRPRD
jgi:hypothetical protein